MRFLLLFSILLAFFALSAEAQTKRPAARKPIPKTFTIRGSQSKPAPIPPKAKAEEDSLGIVVEKFISRYVIQSDGTGTETREMQQRCLTDSCVTGLELFKQTYNGNLQKVKILDAFIIRVDGTQTKIAATAITDRPTDQAEAAPGFSSLRELQVSFEGLKVGESASVKIELTTVKPMFDGRFDALDVFPLLYDWKSIEIDVSAPASLPLYIDAFGLEGGKVADEDGRSRWQYKKVDIRRIEYEPMMQDIAAISPRFALTTFADADALGAIFWEGVKKKAVVTPGIQALADEITKDAPNAAQQASAIYDWVNRNIRYLSVVLDRGGWIPHSTTEIIKNGYGDCKDYATIIHTLLKAKGIDSVPVLIRSDFGDWFPSVPTADYFNHVILYIPSIDTFADATTPNTRLGLVHQTLVGKRGVLAGQKTGVIQLPRDNPDDNQMLSDLTLDFEENGSLKARSKNSFVGRSEIVFRPLFGSSELKRDASIFVKILLSYYGLDGEGDIISVGNPHKVGEPFRVEFETRIRNFTTFLPKGTLELPPGLNMISTAGMGALATTESRKTNLLMGATRIRENIVVNLPPSVKALSAPAAVDFSNAVGSLRVTSETKSGVLQYTRELVFKKDVVEPKEYPLLKQLIEKLMTQSILAFDYAADSSLLRAKSRELRTTTAKGNPSTSTIDPLFGFARYAKLTPADVRRLEAKLTLKPDDLETRRALIDHYSFSGSRKAQVEAHSVRHRIWLIEHHPEIGDFGFFGFSRQSFSSVSIDLLTKAWLAQVSGNKNSSSIRVNAFNSLKVYAPAAALSVAEEGVKLDPQNYEFLLLIAEMSAEELSKASVQPEVANAAARRVFEHGTRALALLKKERSDERDAHRAQLLRHLCTAAIRLGELDAASSYAQELVLDFGQTSDNRMYDQAAHIGNTTLGLVALRRNNLAKAKEHLLASIRAPLRMGYNNLSRIEMSLAKELYDKGEKAAVVEYLKLCQTIPNFKVYPESYADEVYALKLWIAQIEKGTTPNFDFGSPESRKPLSESVVQPVPKRRRSQE